MTKQQALNMLCSAEMYLRTQIHAETLTVSFDLAEAEDILDDLSADLGTSFDMEGSFKQSNKYADKWLERKERDMKLTGYARNTQSAQLFLNQQAAVIEWRELDKDHIEFTYDSEIDAQAHVDVDFHANSASELDELFAVRERDA